ncbi:MAG: phosphatidylinositol kinase [Desulfobacteraceae bacterium IS3]|nr:MAG: phosphatidylinositol kinase [Desulfobacteraceae bacterium IS3]
MRKRKNKANVYLREFKAGLLERTDMGYRFTYHKTYLSLPDAEPVSLTLPLRETPYTSEKLFPFFLGLLPEGWFLDITCRTLKIDSKSKFDLLLATCGECIGAVSVFPAEESESA